MIDYLRLKRETYSFTLKEWCLLPFMLVPLLAYRRSSYRDRLEKDVDRFWSVHYGCLSANYDKAIVRELVNCIEFRNLFFFRCGRIGRLLSHISLFFFRKQQLLSFGVARERLGGSFYPTWILYSDYGTKYWG